MPASWIDDSWTPYTEGAWYYKVGDNFDRTAYGYQWWIIDAGPHTYYLAWGHGGQQIAGPRLQVPHPGIALRSFVLYPLAELDSELEIPGRGRVKELLSACPKGRLARLDTAAPSFL